VLVIFYLRGSRCLFKLLSSPVSGGFGLSFAVESEVLLLGLLGGSLGASENVFVLLLGEVDIVVSVRVTELGRVVSVVLPERVGAEVAALSVLPGLQGEVRHGSALVVVGDGHSAFVGLVVDDLSTEIPLLLLLESLEDVVGADLHHRQLIIDAVVSILLGSANLELADFLVAAAGNEVGNEGHVLREFHGVLAETTILVTKGLGLAIGLPVIMSLVMAMILVERVIEVTVDPGCLGDVAKEEGHLGVVVGLVIVASSDGVQGLVEIGMDDLVAKVVVTLLPVVLWEV